MVAPVPLDGVGANLSTMPMLSKLSMRISLELDHVCASAVLESKWLHVDAASPEIPISIFLAINVCVRGAETVGNLELFLGCTLDSFDRCLIVRHFQELSEVLLNLTADRSRIIIVEMNRLRKVTGTTQTKYLRSIRSIGVIVQNQIDSHVRTVKVPRDGGG